MELIASALEWNKNQKEAGCVGDPVIYKGEKLTALLFSFLDQCSQFSQSGAAEPIPRIWESADLTWCQKEK